MGPMHIMAMVIFCPLTEQNRHKHLHVFLHMYLLAGKDHSMSCSIHCSTNAMCAGQLDHALYVCCIKCLLHCILPVLQPSCVPQHKCCCIKLMRREPAHSAGGKIVRLAAQSCNLCLLHQLTFTSTQLPLHEAHESRVSLFCRCLGYGLWS